MWVALVVGMLFLAGAAYNAFGPEPNSAEALVGAAIAAVLIGLFFFLRSARGRDAEFSEWLTQNAGAIEQGGARYRDVLITPATVLTRYQAALSFLIVTFKFRRVCTSSTTTRGSRSPSPTREYRCCLVGGVCPGARSTQPNRFRRTSKAEQS